MIVELRQLELFVAVAEEGQFTAAASRCHLSQSSLSTAIRGLERDLGAELFLRTTRRVRLTDAGEALLGEARRTLMAAAAARAAVERTGSELRGTLTIGGIPSAGIFDQAGAVAAFRRAHPAVDIRYTRTDSATLLAALAHGSLDAAFVTMPARLPRGVTATPLATRHLVFVCRPDHPLAGRDSIETSALADVDLVANPPGTLGYQVIQRAVGHGRPSLRVPFFVDELASMLEFVAAGLGSMVMFSGAESMHPGLCAVDLVPRQRWRLGLASPQADLLSPVARAFIASVEPVDDTDADA
jgi:DNA-binding transcriptional LysR family regulator